MKKTATPGSWKPGQSGNAKGRPKAEWTWAGELKKAAEESAKDGKPMKHHISKSLMVQALKGNVQAFREIANRMEGLPEQSISQKVKGKLDVKIGSDGIELSG